MKRPETLGALRGSGYTPRPVKEEVRENLIEKIRRHDRIFPGIIGYDETVIPALINAILAKHDLLLLGLRGQAKSRIVRQLPSLLDEYIPIVRGSEINDNPFRPVSRYAVETITRDGDDTAIEWIHRDERYSEKLATPDVTIADLIGDIDPIKAVSQRLHYSHEGAIHFGLIPRANRGIFAMNELPDLQPRIQVGLFNIMEEKDIQIRGFHVRFPLDIMIVFTANPEDYTSRGNIITPLKDRIDSQIITHYPQTMDDAIAITRQEAWVQRNGKILKVPKYFEEIIEQIAFEARKSEFIDQKSGVSARLAISAMENLISTAERRAILLNDETIIPRLCDLHHVLPGMTGKLELVFEGEQEGSVKVGRALIGKAVREIFKQYFPDPLRKQPRRRSSREEEPSTEEAIYSPILKWFENGNSIEITDEMPTVEYCKQLQRVSGLLEVTSRYMEFDRRNIAEYAAAMEFVLDGLHQNSKIAKEVIDNVTSYKDMVGTIFAGQSRFGDED
ncbi:MAG: sigma 54-interacting transcriptional regulator [Bacteroidota bacterium]